LRYDPFTTDVGEVMPQQQAVRFDKMGAWQARGIAFSRRSA
jgi:hypothetical protein